MGFGQMAASVEQKHVPSVVCKTGIGAADAHYDAYKWLNWVGEYTYGSICTKYQTDDDGEILFHLDKCLYANNYLFIETGQSYCLEYIKEGFEQDRKNFNKLDVEEQFHRCEFQDNVYHFDPNEEKWPQLDKEFLPITEHTCQKEFNREPQYDEYKCYLRDCFKEGYRHIFRHLYEDDMIEIPHKFVTGWGMEDLEEQFKKYAELPHSERYRQGFSHEFIFSHDKDAMAKIQAEIDHVQQVWRAL